MPLFKKIRRLIFEAYKKLDGVFALGKTLKSIKSSTGKFLSFISGARRHINKTGSISKSPEPINHGGEKIMLESVACDLCGSKKNKIRYKKPDNWLKLDRFEYPVVECLDCGLVFVNPRPRKEYMRLFYPPRYYSSRANEEHIKRYEKQTRFLPSLKNEKILDIGFARGDFLKYQKNKYPGISVSELIYTAPE